MSQPERGRLPMLCSCDCTGLAGVSPPKSVGKLPHSATVQSRRTPPVQLKKLLFVQNPHS